MVTFLNELWIILVESSLWLLIGFAIAGAVHVLIPKEWMLKHLSGGGVWPVAKASMLGIPLPLCSCSVIPVAAGLRSQGASKGSSAAFAISTPQTGEESIPITWALFGPIYAITRPIVAVITAMIAGLLIDLTDKQESKQDTETQDPGSDDSSDSAATSLTIVNANDADAAVDHIESRQTTSSCCSSKTSEPVSSCCSSSKPEPLASSVAASVNSCCSSNAPDPASSCCSSEPGPTGLSLSEKFKAGFKHGYGTMVIDLAVWLSIGLLLAALIAAALPAEWISENLGSGIVPKLLMLLVGIPLYICATSSTPLAFSLVVAGLSPGAALVMLLSGPATNVATMSWLIKDLGMRALFIYLSVIASVALIAGILFDAFFENAVRLADINQAHEHGSSHFGIKEIAAVLFVLLMAWALGMKMRAWMNIKGFGTTNPAAAQGGCSSGGCGCS